MISPGEVEKDEDPLRNPGHRARGTWARRRHVELTDIFLNRQQGLEHVFPSGSHLLATNHNDGNENEKKNCSNDANGGRIHK
jgi:hypothetical protein